jgi:hypothetical protein
MKKARSSLAKFLSETADEKVALRASQEKGAGPQERCLQRRSCAMWYAGIDWADQHNDTVVRDEKSHQVGSLRVDHSPEGLATVNTFLESSTGPEHKEQMACIIETTDGLLIAFLLEAGWPIYPVNPRTVDRRRSPAGAKTDTIDAYLLAKTGRADLVDLPPLTPDSDLMQELKGLTRDQDALIQRQTRLVNQVTACLKAYDPVALKLLTKLHQRSHDPHEIPSDAGAGRATPCTSWPGLRPNRQAGPATSISPSELWAKAIPWRSELLPMGGRASFSLW